MATDEKTGPAAVEVSGGLEAAREAFKCPAMSVAFDGPGEELFLRGTMMRLDGEEHRRRRRAWGLLIKQGKHKFYRDTWLFPTADAALAELLAEPDADGFARVDLSVWQPGLQMRLAAALVGFDEAKSAAGAAELARLSAAMLSGRPTVYKTAMGKVDAAADSLRTSVAARDEIIARFYAPAAAERDELAARFERGEIEEEELPSDLLMLMARRLDPAWEDAETREHDALLLLATAVDTTSKSVMWALREIFAWLEEHPGEEARLTEDDFIMRAADETLRLHPVGAGFPRIATADVELADGTAIPAGATTVIRSGPANTDPGFYGEDGRAFDPDREPADGAPAYGLAFGAGPHTCFGMPIVMGTGGMDGSLVYLLKILLEAGIRPDPDAPPTPPVGPTRGDFSEQTTHAPSFPVRFPVAP
jgi:cytochrome P450